MAEGATFGEQANCRLWGKQICKSHLTLAGKLTTASQKFAASFSHLTQSATDKFPEEDFSDKVRKCLKNDLRLRNTKSFLSCQLQSEILLSSFGKAGP